MPHDRGESGAQRCDSTRSDVCREALLELGVDRASGGQRRTSATRQVECLCSLIGRICHANDESFGHQLVDDLDGTLTRDAEVESEVSQFALGNPHAERFEAVVAFPVGGMAITPERSFTPPWAI